MVITRPNQPRAIDITYIPMLPGLVYLAGLLDWASRRVLSWPVSVTTEAVFCVAILEDALARQGKPDIFDTDQGAQFTVWTGKRHSGTMSSSSGGSSSN